MRAPREELVPALGAGLGGRHDVVGEGAEHAPGAAGGEADGVVPAHPVSQDAEAHDAERVREPLEVPKVVLRAVAAGSGRMRGGAVATLVGRHYAVLPGERRRHAAPVGRAAHRPVHEQEGRGAGRGLPPVEVRDLEAAERGGAPDGIVRLLAQRRLLETRSASRASTRYRRRAATGSSLRSLPAREDEIGQTRPGALRGAAPDIGACALPAGPGDVYGGSSPRAGGGGTMSTLAEFENRARLASITCGWKKTELPLDWVRRYWRDVHSPVIARRPGVCGLSPQPVRSGPRGPARADRGH